MPLLISWEGILLTFCIYGLGNLFGGERSDSANNGTESAPRIIHLHKNFHSLNTVFKNGSFLLVSLSTNKCMLRITCDTQGAEEIKATLNKKTNIKKNTRVL